MSSFEEAKLITKYLSRGDENYIKDLTKAIREDNITVTCMGLYNNGKSTLLNALINDLEGKTFETADIRKTKVNKKVKYNNIIFVDTPGLNAREHDDKRVMDAVKESDINLFVHTITTGEFVKKEIDFLYNVKKYWKNPQEFINRTIFVVSRIDNANNESDITNTIEKMDKQISEIFDSKALLLPVSSLRYIKGQKEKKNIMIKRSNIELLQKSIANLNDKSLDSIQKTRKKRLEDTYDDLIKRFNSKFEEKKLEISKQKKIEKEYNNSLNHDIKKIEDVLYNMYSELGD